MDVCRCKPLSVIMQDVEMFGGQSQEGVGVSREGRCTLRQQFPPALDINAKKPAQGPQAFSSQEAQPFSLPNVLLIDPRTHNVQLKQNRHPGRT
jgi:hypothetical protein